MLLAVCTTASTDNRPRRRPTYDWMRRKLRPPPVISRAGVEELWFRQKLDHFDSTNNAIWSQLYHRNDRYYKSGNPVFLFIGGEPEASSSWVSGGFMFTLSRSYGALMLELEHRFYGSSRPTRDISTTNLRYLNSTQALEDLAYFIQQQRLQNPELYSAKWVVFGGSYAGNLAAWARLRYPDITDGAVASSASVLAQANFPEYLEVVAESMQTFDPNCVPVLDAAMKEFEELLQSDAGVSTINELFRLCSPLNVSREYDVAGLTSLVISGFSRAVQYNDVMVGINSTVQEYCVALRSASGNSPLQQLTNFLAGDDTSCFDPDYEASYEEYLSTGWDGDGMRQWLWQTCTDFGYYQTTDSANQPFGPTTRTCAPSFSAQSKYTAERVEEGVRKANLLYGGRTPNVTNVAFVNGGLDPWHALGVLEDISESSPAIVIEYESHCSDLYSPSLLDIPQLTAAHDRIEQLVAQWIN
ncbi:putative serine protease K12H4.7 [Schistocerca serialis cubense]|uniref:putative serine protease K12H4.7 n=1 Tax=Schistocerca serialis cubense TaxID=2023355 RepID=UPI00214E278D|nr:putative serine protease K12H4.7 [Schistocerca serialis cubense]